MKITNFWQKSSILMAILAIGGLSLLRAGEIEVRLLSNWPEPSMNIDQAMQIAEASMAVIDVENMANNPEMLKMIKQRNPKIILICKINLTEIILPTINRPIQTKLIKEMGSQERKFMLKNSAGRLVAAPNESGGYIFNISADFPSTENNPSYNQFIANFFIKNVFSCQVWDGVCVNNSWRSIFILAATNIDTEGFDANQDGQRDEKRHFIIT